jgi:hypothetical protein
VADVVTLFDRPPLRCYGMAKDPSEFACGERAVWRRPSTYSLESTFYCDEHHKPGDVLIAAGDVFRRVTFEVEVRFSATSLVELSARHEALARLEAAVHDAGGTLTVSRVSSIAGRLAPSQGHGWPAPEKEKG